MDRTCRSWSSTPSLARLRETRRQCTAWRAEQPPRSLTSSSLHLLVKVITRTLVHDRWTRAASGGEDSATALRSQGRRGRGGSGRAPGGPQGGRGGPPEPPASRGAPHGLPPPA